MKKKQEFTVSVDSELFKKLLFVASHENNTLNNHMLHMIRQNVQYYEKVHGKISASDTADIDFDIDNNITGDETK